jgi:hypothetical protein
MTTAMNFITKDDIRKMAPVALADKPTREVSSRYVFHSTEQIIDDLGSLGWMPTKASQRAPRKAEGLSKFSPHMVTFAHPDMSINGKDGDLLYPQIIVQNRMDGLGAFKFMAGIFRLVCSNGLVIATEDFGTLSIRHTNYSFDDVRQVVQTRVEVLPEQVENMNVMKQKMLNVGLQRQLATQALMVRNNVKAEGLEAEEFVKNVDPELIKTLITPFRVQDAGKDLWSTFNVVQERLTKGGWEHGKRKAKGLTSFERDLDFNKKLFDLALTMAVITPPKEVQVEEAVLVG